jgi:hypothetical protein
MIIDDLPLDYTLDASGIHPYIDRDTILKYNYANNISRCDGLSQNGRPKIMKKP